MAQELNEKKHSPERIITCILVWLALLVYAGHSFSHMVAAGDTWVALACGRHFVNHKVDTVEPFSANSHKAGPSEEDLAKYPKFTHNFLKKYHPTGWVDQNWLTQYIFYKIVGGKPGPTDYNALNYNGLVVWKFIICLLVITTIYFTSRLLGSGKINSAFFASLAVFVGRSFIDIRPAVYSNLLVPVMILILLLTQHRHYLYIWLIAPLVVFWCNVHGGYLYAFIILVPFWLVNLATYIWKPRFLTESSIKLLTHTLLAGIATFVLMVIFNPYHLTNLTHTFIITVSKNAAEWKNVNEWHSAFELTNPVGTSIPFIWLFCIGGLIFLAWAIYRVISTIKTLGNIKSQPENQGSIYRIDLSYIIIVIFTVFMAVDSRRFIPISAAAFCPLLAMIMEETLKSPIGKLKNKPAKFLLCQRMVIAVFGLAVIIPAVFWTAKFQKAYLAPFGIDDKYDSVFMRMTASYAKPFDACQFIRDNKLSGNMLNYWTEGGFVAMMQDADPETGFIPLKLFMDGRAQAAYDITAFQTYVNDIMGGGEGFSKLAALSQQQRKNIAEYGTELRELAKEMGQEMRRRDVWIYLMPSNAVNSGFLILMRYNPDWKPVYIDGAQQIYVDSKTEKGKKLLDGIFNGETIYPTQELKDSILLNYMISQTPEKAYEKSMELYSKNKSLLSLNLLLDAGQKAGHQKELYEFCKEEVSNFIKNKDEIVKVKGYLNRYSIAEMCLNYINKTSKTYETDTRKIPHFATYAAILRQENMQLREEARW